MDLTEEKNLLTSIRKSERDLTVKNSKLLPGKLEERQKKKILKVNKKISPQEGSSQHKIETEEYFDTNKDLGWDSAADFEENQVDTEDPAYPETIENVKNTADLETV